MSTRENDPQADARRRERERIQAQQKFLRIQTLRNREAELNAQLRDVRDQLSKEYAK